MKLKKYALLALITLPLTIFVSCGVNVQQKCLNSTEVAQISNECKAEADKLFEQGKKLAETSQFDKALKSVEQSLAIYREIGNRQGIAKSLRGLGIIYYSLGDSRKAIDYTKQSLDILKEIGDRQGIAKSLGNLGLDYAQLGNYRKAIDYTNQSLTISKVIRDRPLQAGSLGNLGLTYGKLGDYRKAIDYTKQSLDILKEIKDRQGIAKSVGNLGLGYAHQGDYRKAIDYYEQALRISKKIKNPSLQANSLNNMGFAYHRPGDYRKAIDYYEQALKISKKIENPSLQANSLGNLGSAYYELSDYGKAIDYYEQALKISKEIENLPLQANSLANLGLVYKKLKKYESAEKNLHQAIAIWEDIRSDLGNKDNWKVLIFEEQAQGYSLLQKVLVAQKLPQEALVISEQARTRALVEILWRQLSQKPEEELIPPTPDLKEIKQIAQQQNATLVEYSVTPDEIYIWVIPPQGKIQFRRVTLPKNTSLKKLVKISRDSIGVRGRNSNNSPTQQENPTNRLQQLHQLLIKPIADLLPKDEQQRVIFIPHQELFLVPFVALQDEENKYLIEKHTILTAPSIQALDLSQKNKQVQKNPSASLARGDSALIVGNPTIPKGGVGQELEPLKPLPGAEEEANKIAEMLNTKAIIGDQATKSAIVEKMASAKLIHLATHGLLDGTNAIGSAGAIALTPVGKNDGFLTTSEIMERFGLPGKQKLKADLLVLSACDTGRGDIRAEGIIGLSRAFIASGVPTLVVSLWKVPDDATTNLMTEFYTNIYERKFDKAKAMREAMLTMLEDDPDPINWAAFTVIGKAE